MAASGIPDPENPPSRRPAPSRPSIEDAYGLDEPPRPDRRFLPDGIEEVEPGSPVSRRLAARSDGMFAPPKPKKKGREAPSAWSSRLVSAWSSGLVGIAFASAFVSGFVRGFNNARGLSSRATLEAILEERVQPEPAMAGLLSGVNDASFGPGASRRRTKSSRALRRPVFSAVRSPPKRPRRSAYDPPVQKRDGHHVRLRTMQQVLHGRGRVRRQEGEVARQCGAIDADPGVWVAIEGPEAASRPRVGAIVRPRGTDVDPDAACHRGSRKSRRGPPVR